MVSEARNRILEIRCPACASEHKQKVANITLSEDAEYKTDMKPGKNCFSSIELKCTKCKAKVFLNIYNKKEKELERELSNI